MQKHYQPPLLLTLHASQRLLQLMIAVHILAAAACVLNNLPVLIKGVLLIAISCHFYSLFKQSNIEQCAVKHTDLLHWELKINGEWLTVEVLPSTVVSLWAIFLHLKADNDSQHTLIIFSDSLAAEDYRALTVRLKITFHEKQNSQVPH